MTTITTRQRDYITSLREGFTPNRETIARNSDTLADLMRNYDNYDHALMARATYGMDESTVKGRRMRQKAASDYRQVIDAMSQDELDAKRDEIIATIPDFAAERVSDIQWAETTDLDSMTKEDASRAIDILNRQDFIFSETLGPFTKQLVAEFIDWYAAQ